MKFVKAVVIANRTAEGLSVIGIDVFADNGMNYNLPTKRLIDSINAIPGLSREKIKAIVARQYDIPKESILFR